MVFCELTVYRHRVANAKKNTGLASAAKKTKPAIFPGPLPRELVHTALSCSLLDPMRARLVFVSIFRSFKFPRVRLFEMLEHVSDLLLFVCPLVLKFVFVVMFFDPMAFVVNPCLCVQWLRAFQLRHICHIYWLAKLVKGQKGQ